MVNDVCDGVNDNLHGRSKLFNTNDYFFTVPVANCVPLNGLPTLWQVQELGDENIGGTLDCAEGPIGHFRTN
jgi:hypothetical protein